MPRDAANREDTAAAPFHKAASGVVRGINVSACPPSNTPASTWVGIREKCATHLRLGGNAATLPYANKIWMLFGFELFACLRGDLSADTIEVYPFAIVRASLPAYKHKSTEEGYGTNSLLYLPARGGSRRSWKQD